MRDENCGLILFHHRLKIVVSIGDEPSHVGKIGDGTSHRQNYQMTWAHCRLNTT